MDNLKSSTEEHLVQADGRPVGQPALDLVIATTQTAPLMPGRRESFKYRDLGVTTATRGKMRAQVQHASEGLAQPTGWHYHVCEVQFAYMLSGWIEIEFEDGTTRRISAGDSIMIPPFLKHNEIRTSESFEVIEVVVPSDMGTVACDPPANWKGTATRGE